MAGYQSSVPGAGSLPESEWGVVTDRPEKTTLAEFKALVADQNVPAFLGLSFHKVGGGWSEMCYSRALDPEGQRWILYCRQRNHRSLGEPDDILEPVNNVPRGLDCWEWTGFHLVMGYAEDIARQRQNFLAWKPFYEPG